MEIETTDEVTNLDHPHHYPSISTPSRHRRSTRRRRATRQPTTISTLGDPSAAGPQFPIACTECDKRFSSWKALFGHMRCHPNRPYRGMLNFRSRRHQEPLTPSYNEATGGGNSSTVTEEDYEVADCLLLMANAAAANDDDPNLSVNQAATAADSNTDSRIDDGGESVGLVRQKCSTYLRVFSRGRGLGGSRKTSSSHCRIFGFDLNTLSCPPPLLAVQDNDDSSSAGLNLELRLSL